MIHTTSYPHSLQTHHIPQTYHPNPPPKQKIITSKDEAIQQLIHQNTILKKQLSQIMLKTTYQNLFHNPNQLQSAIVSGQPSVSHLASYRNSRQNSTQFSSGPFCPKDNYFTDQVCEKMPKNQGKIIVQRQNKRAYCHSLDNLLSGHEGKIYQHLNQPQNTIISFSDNQNGNHQKEYQLKNSPPILDNQRLIKLQTYQNLANTLPCSIRQQYNCISEQEMYKEKMIKLKGRRNSQSKKLSEEKPIKKHESFANTVVNPNNNPTKANQVQNKKMIENQSYRTPNQLSHHTQLSSKLIKLHEVLKQKLNSPDYSPTLKSKAQLSLKQQNPIDQTYLTSMPLTHDKNPTQQKKMIPKYTPKNFSRQKQNKSHKQQNQVLVPILNPQNSEKTRSRNQTETTDQQISRKNIKVESPVQNQQKKVCLRQLRGRVYLDDEGQEARTKRAISKNNNSIVSQNHVNTANDDGIQGYPTKRHHIKQVKPQISKRINTAESQVTYINTESFRKLQMTENVMARKNSNKVYLQEDQVDKPVFKSSKNKEPTKSKGQELSLPPKSKIELVRDNVDELVSIEEIHMISDNSLIQYSSKRQTIQSSKRSPPLSRQNSVHGQWNKSKNLYNQVYCEQSKKDLHC